MEMLKESVESSLKILTTAPTSGPTHNSYSLGPSTPSLMTTCGNSPFWEAGVLEPVGLCASPVLVLVIALENAPKQCSKTENWLLRHIATTASPWEPECPLLQLEHGQSWTL